MSANTHNPIAKARNTRRGASVSSYGLVVGLISVVALAAVTSVGDNVNVLMTEVADTTQEVVDEQIAASATPTPTPAATCSQPDDVFASSGSNTVTVPANCTTLVVFAWGAGGGGGNDNNSSSSDTRGGGGAYVTASLSVTPGASIQVNVGEGGTYNESGVWTCQGSVFNGGGDAGGRAGTGGGATDIRIGGTALGNRALVAAGGGGGGYTANGTNANGGGGGLTTGVQGGAGWNGSNTYGALGGTQSAGGASGRHSNSAPTAWGVCTGNGTGALGVGASGTTCGGCLGGGGGGGYYGGGGGAAYNGGGGGSSLVPSGGSGEAGTIALSGGQAITERPGAAVGNGGAEHANGSDGAIVLRWQ
ncbi:MAG: hypothetical protein Alpg2KO_21350 [Alphaproteobacteria bacterium]